MKRSIARLAGWLTRVRTSFWFVPALMVLGSIALAVGMVWLDTNLSREALVKFPRLFGSGPQSSRSLLAAIAGSMITVAGVTFSITVVAVAQASMQYSSRVLRSFMADRAYQVVLGVFVGIFTYCLVVIRTIRDNDQIVFIPAVSVLVAILLAIVGVGFLIFFIHHIAESLQAAHLADRISSETVRAADRLFPDDNREGEEATVARDWQRMEEEAAPWSPVATDRTGYIQGADKEGLTRIAAEAGRLVRMDRAIGDFVVEGQSLASLSGGTGVDEETRHHLRGAYVVLPYRTVHQDVAFGVRQLVDVALKALSPGVNDTTTAIACIDHLTAVLSRVGDRRLGSRLHLERGRPVVLEPGPSFRFLVDTAFDEIRRCGAGNVSVLGRMLTALETMGGFTPSPARRRILLVHVDRIEEITGRTIPAPQDQEALQRRCAEARRALEPRDDGTGPASPRESGGE